MSKVGPFELNSINCIDAVEGMRQLPLGSVDLIITDPPYEKAYLYLYGELAKQSPRILKRNASLLTIVGHYAVPDVIEMFSDKLNFRWIICMNQFGQNHARLKMGIEVMWKPILWYVNGTFSGDCYIMDGIVSSGREGILKENHHWEQDLDWLYYYIEKLCPKGGVVLDPFIGSGGTAVVCSRLGRNYVGFDIELKYVEAANERVRDEGEWSVKDYL